MPIHHSYPPQEELQRMKRSVLIPLLFVGLIWIIKLIEIAFGLELFYLGNYPRAAKGIVGIFTYPFIHGDLMHLFSNSIPLLVLGSSIFYFYRQVAIRAVGLIYLLSGLFLWIGGNASYHIGASGLVYGFASFVMLGGILSGQIRLMAISLLVVFLYGGMIWGIVPGEPGVSWAGHLFGALAGVIAAVAYRKYGPKPKPREEEVIAEDEDTPDYWNYKKHFPSGTLQVKDDEE